MSFRTVHVVVVVLWCLEFVGGVGVCVRIDI